MIKTQRHPEFDLIVHRVYGEVSVLEIRDTVAASHMGVVHPLEIWDFTEAEVTHLGIEDLGTLLETIFPMVPPREGERTAFIVPGSLEQEVAALFQRMAAFQDFPVDMRSFPEMESAIIWLFPRKWQRVQEALSTGSHGLEAQS